MDDSIADVLEVLVDILSSLVSSVHLRALELVSVEEALSLGGLLHWSLYVVNELRHYPSVVCNSLLRAASICNLTVGLSKERHLLKIHTASLEQLGGSVSCPCIVVDSLLVRCLLSQYRFKSFSCCFLNQLFLFVSSGLVSFLGEEFRIISSAFVLSHGVRSVVVCEEIQCSLLVLLLSDELLSVVLFEDSEDAVQRDEAVDECDASSNGHHVLGKRSMYAGVEVGAHGCIDEQ